MPRGENFNFIKFAGLCGIIGPVTALSMVFAAIAYSPWFTWEGNALSDLGVHNAAILFNSALVMAGVLNFFFALGVRKSLKSTKLVSIGALLLILGGGSLALVGIFTAAEATRTIHQAVSLGYFVLSPLALSILGAGMIQLSARTQGMLTILAGTTALAAIFGLWNLWRGIAIAEIIEAIILATWIVAMGIKLVTHKPSKA